MLTNEVVISIVLLLVLSLLRINVVIALIISAITAGLIGHSGDLGLLGGLQKTVDVFTQGLGGGASIAMNYAVLGAFAVALSRSGVTDLLAYKVIKLLGHKPDNKHASLLKYVVLFVLVGFSMSSQNLIPIHIAFIPILVPPLLGVMNHLRIDRRAVACALTFGLTATYMLLPVGFGQIFINNVLVKNINESGLITVSVLDVSKAMLIPVAGMILGLLFAFFVSYRKPRVYASRAHVETSSIEEKVANVKPLHVYISIAAICATILGQLVVGSTIMGALLGLIIFALGGVFKPKQTNDIFQDGLRLMAMIGFVMIAASGFAAVIKSTGGVPELVQYLNEGIGASNKGLAAFLMLLIGLFITMGIGSSFSTVPIIASIYVPLCLSFGFSPMATTAIVGVAAALGDAGSPASDSTLGPTSGLNADGKHDHIYDSVLPTFLHFNIPLLVFGWIAAMIL